jgi:hypothetical protein
MITGHPVINLAVKGLTKGLTKELFFFLGFPKGQIIGPFLLKE